MNKKISIIIWLIVLILTIINLVIMFDKPKNEITLKQSKLFMDKVTQCPNDINTSDRFICLFNLAEATVKETNALAEKLISQAPIRLKEIETSKTGPASFVYGGEDFLNALPEQVKKAQKAKDQYINSICNLTSMTIFGGSGMDLEQNACSYYFTNEYLQILKGLEGGLTNGI